jgi:hypothetical protein
VQDVVEARRSVRGSVEIQRLEDVPAMHLGLVPRDASSGSLQARFAHVEKPDPRGRRREATPIEEVPRADADIEVFIGHVIV